MQERVLLCYIPVLHNGYYQLFLRYPEAKTLYLFGESLVTAFDHLRKDIRRIPPDVLQKALLGLGLFDQVIIVETTDLHRFNTKNVEIIVSDDDITQEIVVKYLPDHQVIRDTIFLRWDKKTSIDPVQISPDITISHEEFDRYIMDVAHKEGQKSKDWWRRLGAVVVRNKKILSQVHNVYVPSDQVAYDEGDPRSNFKGGIHLESSLALHAEANIVAQAAKEGTSLEDADMYVEVFPCPQCAKLIAYSGIRRLYYRIGYNVLDGERIMKSQGVEIIFVQEAAEAATN